LNNVDDAMKRRLNVIPFVHKPEQINEQLADQLKPEYPGILYWAIQGCLDWQKNGLKKPAAVQAETDHYFSEQDMFGQWLDECTEPCGVTQFESNKTLYESWKNFALSRNEEPGTQRTLSSNLIRAGYQNDRTRNQGRGFKAIKVKIQTCDYDPYAD
jgi:putative DNA primase/helicase